MSIDPSRAAALAAAYAAAWCSQSPEAVAEFFAPDGSISVNLGEASVGRAAIAEMAAGFYAEFPGLTVLCDGVRAAGDHVVFLWTLEGRHAVTGNHVRVPGWEEWTLDADLKVHRSLGWFDAAEYARQIAEGV